MSEGCDECSETRKTCQIRSHFTCSDTCHKPGPPPQHKGVVRGGYPQLPDESRHSSAHAVGKTFQEATQQLRTPPAKPAGDGGSRSTFEPGVVHLHCSSSTVQLEPAHLESLHSPPQVEPYTPPQPLKVFRTHFQSKQRDVMTPSEPAAEEILLHVGRALGGAPHLMPSPSRSRSAL